MKAFLRKYYTRLQWFFAYSRNTYYLLSAQEIETLRSGSKNSLNRAEHKIYSQHGEDGIIDEIFKRIGTTSKTFFEFGAGSGTENNTIALLINGWKGWWVDGGKYIDIYRKLYATSIGKKDLNIGSHFVSSKNINEIAKKIGIPKEIDLLSVDIDGNDYYVWEALEATSPRVVIIEYNAVYLPGRHFLQDESITEWDGSNFFGASLHTLNELAKRKGYTLVCCDLIGANAFFVRNDLVSDLFESAGDVGLLWQKPKYYLNYYGGHMSTVNYGTEPAMGKWKE